MKQVEVENSIIEMRKVGTMLKAFNEQEPESFTPEDAHRALQITKEVFDNKMESLEAAFYGEEEKSSERR